jgi:hypothetical protein
MNNEHQSTTATHFKSQGWGFYTGLTVSEIARKMLVKMTHFVSDVINERPSS